MDTDTGLLNGEAPLVLLFYDGYELRAADSWLGRILSRVRGELRKRYRTMRGKQVFTGFYVAFDNLVKSLRVLGCDVRINDFGKARHNPHHPIGLAGYPSVLERTAHLPNPILFGPGDPGSPLQTADRAREYRLSKVIQPSEWYVQFYEVSCPDLMVRCPCGIDTERFGDCRHISKSIDILIYDKIRWNLDVVRSQVITPLIEALEVLGLDYKIIRYGEHTQAHFLQLAQQSRVFAFICEHETQGLALEEVMSLNVPILAWDEGKLADPTQITIAPSELKVSSVPYWDDRCGLKFRIGDDVSALVQQMLSQVNSFQPREYVLENLTFERCGRTYLEIYRNTGR